MTTLWNEYSNETTMTSQGSSRAASEASNDIFAGLPTGHANRLFTNMRKLNQDAVHVRDTLMQNLEKGDEGNQYLVICGLTQPAIKRLQSDSSSLEVNYRFQWDGSTGIIKILPTNAHEYTTRAINNFVTEQLFTMGIDYSDRSWGGASTYQARPARGKEADEIFTPASRRPHVNNPGGWPTLVIETGVSESHPKLEQDAIWWFQNSSGDVRIVLIIVVRKAYVLFEKWQLAPPNAPKPVPRTYIEQLKANPALPPPTVTQTAANQHAYCHQQVKVTATAVTGDPMILPFSALYDRPPGPNEGDVTFTSQMFRTSVQTVFT